MGACSSVSERLSWPSFFCRFPALGVTRLEVTLYGQARSPEPWGGYTPWGLRIRHRQQANFFSCRSYELFTCEESTLEPSSEMPLRANQTDHLRHETPPTYFYHRSLLRGQKQADFTSIWVSLLSNRYFHCYPLLFLRPMIKAAYLFLQVDGPSCLVAGEGFEPPTSG